MNAHIDGLPHFGGCPVCGKTDGYFNDGPDHWFVCIAHSAKWCVGSNLFSCWRGEGGDIWKENRERFALYRIVTPLYGASVAGWIELPKRVPPGKGAAA